jgi:8-oxo-dGTP diphosphatase
MAPEGSSPIHCPACGAVYPDSLILDDEGARNCPACGFANYILLKVGAAAIVENDASILLLRRAHEPFKGFWGLPAGYVRWNERPEDAVVRETAEECGLVVETLRLLGAYYFDNDPRGNGILLTYLCVAISGTPKASPEASEARYFPPSDLPTPIAGSGQDDAIKAWKNERGAAPQGDE